MREWWCGACRMPYDRRSLPGAQCVWVKFDNMIVVLLITHLVTGNNVGVQVQSLIESRKSRLAEAHATFTSVALVTVGELGQ